MATTTAPPRIPRAPDYDDTKLLHEGERAAMQILNFIRAHRSVAHYDGVAGRKPPENREVVRQLCRQLVLLVPRRDQQA